MNQGKVVERKLSELKRYSNNPRMNEQTANELVKVMEQYGYLVFIVIDTDNVIIAGDARYQALCYKADGQDIKVKCILGEHLTAEQVTEWRLIDNKTSEFADWDKDRLMEELSNIQIDMSDFGFDVSEVEGFCEQSFKNSELDLTGENTFHIKLVYDEKRYGELMEKLPHLETSAEDLFYEMVMKDV